MECDRRCNNAICCKQLSVNLYFNDFINYDYEFTEDENSIDYHIARNKDGSCIYLKNNKCSIYNDRPIDCKEYCCYSR